MKSISLFFILIFNLLMYQSTYGQEEKQTASAVSENWTVYNREVFFEDDVIHLDAQPGDGILWLNKSEFGDGAIEVDIKGKSTPGQSFVGVAFHGKDNEAFDAIYFRPFNFLNLERNSHSVQYIAMPENDWATLRSSFPGKYENAINPIPDPVDDWFHARIVLDYPSVTVYINGSAKPTLVIEQISDRKHGKFGLWVGNNSEGWFKNLALQPKQ